MLKRLIFVLVFFCSMICCVHAQTETAVSDAIPWSGWWWPETSGGLATGQGYRDHPAPLEKYDLLTSNVQQGPATQFYLQHNYDPSAPSWFGLCDSWAAASILEPIDFAVSTVQNLYFYIGDKKGLLTLAHELDNTGGHSQAMDSPLVLHEWLQRYIRDGKKAFYADLEPGIQSWNYPIYKYHMDITDFTTESYVICTVYYANDMVDPDFSGTQELSQTYYYTLFKDGNGYSGGAWGMQSSYDHPENLVLPEKRVAKNPYLDYPTIKMIAQSKDDGVESDLPVSLNPGMYNLVLMNLDHYILNADASDSVYLVMERLDTTDEVMRISIKDALGENIYTGMVSGESKMPLDYGQPPYEVIVTKDSYDTPGIYRLTYDIKKQFEYIRPKAQKGYGWGGYALVNATGSEIKNITLSGYTQTGDALDSYLGPFSLAPFAKKTILSSDFPFRNQIEKQDFYGIKIHSPETIRMVNMSGLYGTNMALFPVQKTGKKLIISANPNYGDYAIKKSWGIYNPSARTATISMRLFSRDGNLEENIELYFGPKEIKHFDQFTSPFKTHTDNGWVSIESEQEISGYEEWLSNRSDSNEVLPALISGKEFYVPNPSTSGEWSTQLSLINTADTDAIVSVSLINNLSDDITTLLPLSAYEAFETDVKTLFPGVSDDLISSGILKIGSENEIAGYYKYIVSSQKDFISIPFTDADDMKMVQTIPHVASSSTWWTGVSLCNIGDQSSVLKIIPYDDAGNPLAEGVVRLTLEKNEKYTNLVAGIFANNPDLTISHLVISVEQGSPVFGTYGYGSSDMKMLAGSKLN